MASASIRIRGEGGCEVELGEGWKRFQAQSGRADDVVVGFRNRPLGVLLFDSPAISCAVVARCPCVRWEEALDRLQGLDNFVERLGLISDAAGLRGTGHVSRRPVPRSGRLQLRDGRRHVDKRGRRSFDGMY